MTYPGLVYRSINGHSNIFIVFILCNVSKVMFASLLMIVMEVTNVITQYLVLNAGLRVSVN